MFHIGFTAGLIVVVAKHPQLRDADGAREFGREDARFIGRAVVREVAAQEQNVCPSRDGRQHGLQLAL